MVKGGFISIINHMLKTIPKSAIKCNEPVMKITWANNENNDVIVRASSGQEYHCSHVIVTCPIGFLRGTVLYTTKVFITFAQYFNY